MRGERAPINIRHPEFPAGSSDYPYSGQDRPKKHPDYAKISAAEDKLINKIEGGEGEDEENFPTPLEQGATRATQEAEELERAKRGEAESEAWKAYYAKVGREAPKVSEVARHLEDKHEKALGAIPREIARKYNRKRHRPIGGKPKGKHPAHVPPYKTEFREVA